MVQVGFLDRFVRDQVGPKILATPGDGAGTGGVAQNIFLHVQRLTGTDTDVHRAEVHLQRLLLEAEHLEKVD
ncbi:hypothetical protein D3C85_1559110 [compost metagenome]